MKKKIRNFFEIGMILAILFALIIPGVATTESTLSEEILGFSDAEFEWVPVYGDGLHTIVGDEIVLHEVPQLVTLEIHVSNWNPSILKTLQATVDSAGYSNGVGGTLVPFGWPGSPEDGCFIDNTRTDYVFYGLTDLYAVYTADLEYKWGSTLIIGEKPDDGHTYYLGTLILEVPIDASGTYTIDFLPDGSKTFMNDKNGQSIIPLILTPAMITINKIPNAPTINGPNSGNAGTSYTYTFISIDPDGDQVSYNIDWDDGTTPWTAFQPSGPPGYSESHTWTTPGTYTIKAKVKDLHGAISSWSTPLIVTISPGVNHPPNKPSAPNGPTSGSVGNSYPYTAVTTDQDGDQIQYLFDWGDGQTSAWTTPVNSGQPGSASHAWSSKGSYQVKVKARDIPEFAESDWSDPLSITITKSKPYINTPFLQFIQIHPLIYQLLQRLLKL